MPIVFICLMFVYAALALFVWHYHKMQAADHYPLKIELAIVALALFVHGVVLSLPIFYDHILITGLGYSISLIVWLMLIMYWCGSFFIG